MPQTDGGFQSKATHPWFRCPPPDAGRAATLSRLAELKTDRARKPGH